MAGTPSTSTILRVGRQTVKGTPIGAGFTTGLMEQSSFFTAFDELSKTPEHGGASVADRATARKSATARSGYLVRGSFRQAAYPRLLGLWLRGAGFTSGSPTAGTTAQTHAFTLANRSAVNWLTILHTIGGTARRATDARVTRLTLTAQPDGLKFAGEWRALTEDDPAGTETTTAEDTNEILPSNGALTMTYDPGGADVEILNTTTDELNRLTLDIANPLDEADQALFRFGRADLAQTGVDITGTVEGAPVDWAAYDYIIRQSGANPSASPAICSLEYNFQSTVDIAGDTVPYEITVTIPQVEVTINESGFSAEGDNLIRWTYDYRMLDTVTTPITIELVNLLATAY